MKITFEGAKAKRPHPWLWRPVRVGVLLALLVMFAAVAIGSTGDLMVAIFAFGISLLAIAVVARGGGVPTLETVGTLAAAREGLYEGERLLVPRESVRGALPVQYRETGTALVLLTRSGPVLVDVDKAATARRLQEALQLDAEHVRSQVLYAKPIGSAIVYVVVLSMLTFILFSTIANGVSVLGVLALLPMIGVAFWRVMLTIGDDGLSLRALGSERFIAYSEVEAVDAVEATEPGRPFAPRFALRSGKNVTMDQTPELHRRLGVQVDEAVLERAQDALERYRRRAARAPVLPLSLSAQSTGSPADRVRALTSKEHGGDAYRSSGTDQDALRRAVDEPTLPPRLRAEAALMLAAARNDGDLERIRRAAERSACRPLRKLFEAVADGAGDAKLARALGRVG